MSKRKSLGWQCLSCGKALIHAYAGCDCSNPAPVAEVGAREWSIAFNEGMDEKECYKRYVSEEPFNNLIPGEYSVRVIERSAFERLTDEFRDLDHENSSLIEKVIRLEAELKEQKEAYEFLWKMRIQDEQERK